MSLLVWIEFTLSFLLIVIININKIIMEIIISVVIINNNYRVKQPSLGISIGILYCCAYPYLVVCRYKYVWCMSYINIAESNGRFYGFDFIKKVLVVEDSVLYSELEESAFSSCKGYIDHRWEEL